MHGVSRKNIHALIISDKIISGKTALRNLGRLRQTPLRRSGRKIKSYAFFLFKEARYCSNAATMDGA